MTKRIVVAVVLVLVFFLGYKAWYYREVSQPTAFSPPLPGDAVRVTRLPGNPIITYDMDPSLVKEADQYGYVNINGPSMIAVPAWVKEPLGKYYLYFAHHKGDYIKLAYADHPLGPWKIYPEGALNVNNSHFATTAPSGKKSTAVKALWKRVTPTEFWTLLRVGLAAREASRKMKEEGLKVSGEMKPHVASPEAYIDEEKKEIRLYFHGLTAAATQLTRVAVSRDGIHFNARPEIITAPYLRVFRYNGYVYGLSMPGLLYRSRDGLTDFEVRPKPLAGVDMRHTALLLKGSTLYVFWTRVGDAPESILCSTIDLRPDDWADWRLSEPVVVLAPDEAWEGGDLPVAPSQRTEITVRARQLRDPAVFEDNGKTYLLYAVGGEHAIAIGELSVTDR